MQGGFPNIRHMRVFLETVRTGSIGTAAALCNLSQPAATQAIARIEAVLGTPLLNRKRQQSSVTPCGAVFQERAAAALEHLKEGAAAALREGGAKGRTQHRFETQITASQLRNLIAIANTGSFTVAAQTLGLSQPTVHRAARSLEAVAGVPFFAARPSGVRLTSAAEAFVLRAKLAQSEIRQGIEEISQTLGIERAVLC